MPNCIVLRPKKSPVDAWDRALAAFEASDEERFKSITVIEDLNEMHYFVLPKQETIRKRSVWGVIRRRPRGGSVNPGHQFRDAADWMPGSDLGEGVGQIGLPG
jgi:hypothetical protein